MWIWSKNADAGKQRFLKPLVSSSKHTENIAEKWIEFKQNTNTFTNSLWTSKKALLFCMHYKQIQIEKNKIICIVGPAKWCFKFNFLIPEYLFNPVIHKARIYSHAVPSP